MFLADIGIPLKLKTESRYFRASKSCNDVHKRRFSACESSDTIINLNLPKRDHRYYARKAVMFVGRD
jgi:hypothetical protein